jgi:hypothetical protein
MLEVVCKQRINRELYRQVVKIDWWLAVTVNVDRYFTQPSPSIYTHVACSDREVRHVLAVNTANVPSFGRCGHYQLLRYVLMLVFKLFTACRVL